MFAEGWPAKFQPNLEKLPVEELHSLVFEGNTLTNDTNIPREQLLRAALAKRLQKEASLRSVAVIDSEILVSDRNQALPLSFAQQRLWFLTQMDGFSEAYHMPIGLRLRGELDIRALRYALDRIVFRHEALRTTFRQVEDAPVQHIAPADSGFPLQEHDLSHHPKAAMALSQRTSEEATRPFDMEHGPLFRGQLIRMGENEHVLLLTMHHIVSDAWSIGLLIHELITLYSSHHENRDDPLPPLPIQYADYALWQRRWLSDEVLKKQSEYWRRMLVGAPALLELPTDRPRPTEQTFAGGRVELALGETLTDELKALSRRHGMTLYMTILAAWATVLSRLSGQRDVVIGTPVANRRRPELENLIGFFVNTQALRVEVSGSVTELLDRVKGIALDAQDNQELPFEQVVEIVKPLRSLSHTPIFQAMLAWDGAGGGDLDFCDMTMSFLDSGYDTAKFDLTLNLGEREGQIVGGLDYATALFDQDTIERQVGYLHRILVAMVADERQSVDLIELMDDEERRSLLALGDGGPGIEGASVTLYDLVAEQAARSPDAIAVVEPGTELTYRQLTQRANGLARQLRRLGAGPECRVAILADRSAESIVGVLGILATGAAYVPLDPTYPDDRLAYVLNDAAVLALIAPTALAERAAACVTLRPELSGNVLVIGQAPSDESPPAMAGDAGNAAYVIYTSGSTGVPKGVVVEHRSAVNLVRSFVARHDFSGQRLLMIPPLIFDASVGDVFPSLAVGAALVLHPAPTELGPAELSRFCREQRVTAIDAPAAMWRQWTEGFVDLSATDHAPVLPDLTLMMFGGEAVSLDQVRRFAKLTGNRVVLSNHYGPTEASVCATMLTTRDGAELSGSELSIGRALPGVQVYVLDAHLQLVPRGIEGELCIGGVQVARGYLNRPELNAEHFVRDPFASGTPSDATARLYRTGDLVRWDTDGTLQFVGRRDHQVKIRGFRIELSEIEVSLTQHPSVRDVAVLAREDVPGDKRLVAYVTASDAAIDVESLRTYLSGVLPEYMVPAAYVQLDALPLTPNGKLDRKALPAPDASAYVARSYEAPVGEVEAALAEIWADVLKLDRVGRRDNFFELGGHSLLAVTVIERMRRADLQADVRALFATPTLMALAAAVGGESDAVVVPPNLIPSDCTAITPAMLSLIDLRQEDIDRIVSQVPGGAANVQDIYPLAPLQEGILFHHMLESKGDVYLSATLLGFDSHERLSRYAEALQAVIQRHDILRSSMAWEGLADPVQVVWRHAPLAVEEVKLDPADGDIAEQLRTRFDPRHYRLDIRQAPIMRLFYAEDSANGRWVVLEMMHHLLGDHATLAVMQEEIQAHLSGQEQLLPPPLQFRNFVAQTRLGVSSEEHEAFFTRLLGDIDEPTDPFGLQDVQGNGSRIVEASREVDPQLCIRLRARASALGVSVASVCHLAWAQVLARICGREEVVFGTVMLGRMLGGEGTARGMGMFINTLPVRMRIGDESARTSVRRMHELLTQLLRHEHASLALVQRCSAVRAPAPLFTALLNYRHADRSVADQDAQAGQAWNGIEFLGGGERTNYPVGLSIDDFGSGLSLNAQVDETIDPQRLCAFMLTALESLTIALEQAPTTSVRCLEVLPGTERKQLLVDFNDTAAEYPQQQCIHELFEAQVARTPDAIALVYEEQTLSYGELNKRSNQLAHHLISLGVQPDDRVAICAERGLEMVVGLLGILKAGGAYVPLDPSYPVERLIYMLKDSAPVAMLTCVIEHSAVLSQLVGLAGAIPIRDLIIDAGCWSTEPQGNPVLETAELTSRNLAYVIYTSGSSGLPKGVMVEHRSLINLWACLDERMFQGLPANLRVGLNAAISFDASLQSLSQLLSGHCLVLIPQHVRTDSSALLQLLQRQNVQVFDCTPVQLDMLLAAGLLDAETPYRALAVLVGGEAINPATWARLRQSSTTAFYNVYGPTECTVDATMCALRSTSDLPNIGRPIANTQIYILDAYHQPAPLGVAGELYIGGAGVARGYLDRCDLTAARFIPDPFSAQPQARMYMTGDLGRWLPDGSIEFIGRNDFQVKIRGYRIELGEIEARLSEHSSVRDAVVLAREDTPGDKRLVAYVTSKGEINAEVLRAHLISLLPEHMVPAAYVRLDALPLTPSGKLDRKALPAPDGTSYVTRGYEAPGGEAETTIAQIWAKVLKLDRVGRHDNFFELGGHSLSAISLVAALQRHFDAQISDIFRWPTVIEQAQHFLPSGDALRQRIDRVKKSQSSDEENYERMLADSVFQTRIDAYRAGIEHDLELLDTPRKMNYECVLLTGSTGYLGAYLLHELVTTRRCRIIVPVRGIDQKDAERRLRETLDHYFGPAFHASCGDRVEVVVADLAEAHLGMAPEIYDRLTGEVDAIIHSAANVRHYGPYEEFHSANVVSTERLLTLALEGKPKRFHFISTISTAYGAMDAPWAVFTEHDVDIGQEPTNVYVLSKLEAERLVVSYRQRGVVASIHRVGNITYHSKTGHLQKNISESAFFQRTKAFIALRVVPRYLDDAELTFVDQLARTIVLLSEQETLGNQIFHLRNPHFVRLARFLNESSDGLGIQEVESDAFFDRLLELRNTAGHEDAVTNILLHAGLMEEEASSAKPPIVVLAERTERLLAQLGYVWPEPDPQAIRQFVRFAIDGRASNPQAAEHREAAVHE